MEEEEGPNWQQIEVGKTLMSMAAAPGSGSVSRQGTSCSILLPGGYLQFTAVFCLEGLISDIQTLCFSFLADFWHWPLRSITAQGLRRQPG